MSMTDWDTHVKPYLRNIRYRSNAMRHDVAMLSAKPLFETMAESDLADVRRELERALERVSQVQAAYRGKSVMQAGAAE